LLRKSCQLTKTGGVLNPMSSICQDRYERRFGTFRHSDRCWRAARCNVAVCLGPHACAVPLASSQRRRSARSESPRRVCPLGYHYLSCSTWHSPPEHRRRAVYGCCPWLSHPLLKVHVPARCAATGAVSAACGTSGRVTEPRGPADARSPARSMVPGLCVWLRRSSNGLI
jgi:hypothetical protein